MDEMELQRLVVRLTGDGAAYTKMLDAAEKQTKSSTDRMTGTLSGFGKLLGLAGGAGAPVAGAAGAVGGAGGGAASAFTGMLGPLAGVLGVLGPIGIGVAVVAAGFLAAGAAGVGFLAFLSHLGSEGAQSVMELRRLSNQIGVTTEAAAALSVGGEHLGHTLFHMQHATAQLTGAGHGAAGALAKLNIDAGAFTMANTEQQLRMVAAGFTNLTNQTDRAMVARALFGRGGVEMIDLLSRGTAGLDAQAARAERFGLTVSAAEANMVRGSLLSWAQWSDAWEGIKRQLAVGFAPVWEMLGNVGGRVGEALVTVFREWIPVFHEAWVIMGQLGDLGVSVMGSIKDAIFGALGLGEVKFTDFRNLALTALVSVEWGIKNWRTVMEWVITEFEILWLKFKRTSIGTIHDIAAAWNAWTPSFLNTDISPLSNGIRDLDRQIAALTGNSTRILEQMGIEVSEMVRERLADFDALRARSAEIAGGAGAAPAKYKTAAGTEATLAGSERAFTILFSNQQTQEQYLRGIQQETTESREFLQDIRDRMNEAPIVRSA